MNLIPAGGTVASLTVAVAVAVRTPLDLEESSNLRDTERAPSCFMAVVTSLFRLNLLDDLLFLDAINRNSTSLGASGDNEFPARVELIELT